MATYSRKAINNIIKAISDINSNNSDNISIESRFVKDLNESIEKTNNKEQKKPSQKYKPSGMNCMRSCFYSIYGVDFIPEIRSASLCGIGESGTDRHVRIQKALEDMRSNGYDLDYIDIETYIKDNNLEDKLEVISKMGMETKLYMPSLNLSFLTDGIVKYNNKYYIFEFKTEIPNKFYKRTSVDPSHISQGTAYSCAFGINEVLYLYENRATCEHKAYILNVTDEMKNERIYNFINTCNDYVNRKVVPPMPTNKDILKKCKYCLYTALCAKHGLGEKSLEDNKERSNKNE